MNKGRIVRGDRRGRREKREKKRRKGIGKRGDGGKEGER